MLFTDAYDPFDGTAVLAAGTKAIANTAVTANSLIECGVLTPGGAVGAPFIASKTAGTGFTITSTSATDTSTVWYRFRVI